MAILDYIEENYADILNRIKSLPADDEDKHECLHIVIEYLIECKNVEKIDNYKRMAKEDKLKYYIVTATRNQYLSSTSKFHKHYRKDKFDDVMVVDKCDDDVSFNDRYNNAVDKLNEMQTEGEITWFEKELFLSLLKGVDKKELCKDLKISIGVLNSIRRKIIKIIKYGRSKENN